MIWLAASLVAEQIFRRYGLYRAASLAPIVVCAVEGYIRHKKSKNESTKDALDLAKDQYYLKRIKELIDKQ